MPALLDVCDYGGPYAGNFIPSLLAVGDAVRERLDLDYVPVFSAVAIDKPWVESVLARGYNPYFITGRPNLVNDVRSLHRLASDTEAVLIRSHFTRFDLSAGLVARSTGRARYGTSTPVCCSTRGRHSWQASSRCEH